MKILVLNGSPKGERSDTLRLTKAFLDGMGETAETVEVAKLGIKPCLGCYGCWWGTPGSCVQKDDMADLLCKITAADLVIWSFPLYCYGFPSGIKAVVDRMLPLSCPNQNVDENGETHHPTRENHAVKMMLISGCGFANREGNFDALIFQFDHCFRNSCAKILCVEAPLLNIPAAAPAAEPYLAAVRRAGAEFAENGLISGQTQAILDAPMLDPEEYRRNINGR